MPDPTHRWTLLIRDYFPPSPNVHIRKHWHVYFGIRVRARARLHITCLANGGVPTFTGPVKVKIVRHWGKGKRAFDHENLVGSGKPLVDAMIELGIIEGDSPKILPKGNLDHEQQRNPYGDDDATYIQVEGTLA